MGTLLGYVRLNIIFESSWELRLIMGLVDSRTLYPPQHTCTNPSCERSQSGHLLKKEEQRQAVLYTLDKGAIPVRSVHLYCDSEFVPYYYYRPKAIVFTGYYQSAGQTITTIFVLRQLSVYIMMEFRTLFRLANTNLLKEGSYDSG